MFDARSLVGSNVTGVGQYVLNSVKNLAVLRPDHQLVGFANSVKNNTQLPDLGSNVRLINYGLSNRLLNIKRLLGVGKPLDKIMGKGHLMWLPNLNYVSVSSKMPYVLTVHDLAFLRMPELYDWYGRLWHSLLRTKKLAREAKFVITPSQSTANDVAEILEVSKDKIKVINSGTNQADSNFAQEFVSLQAKYGIGNRYILFVGTIEPRKNVEAVVSTFSQLLKDNHDLQDMNLVIVGPWGWKTNYVKKEIAVSPFRHMIRVLDYVSADQRSALYQHAQVLLWPSWYEGFGFPVLEAFAHSCPVVTSNNSALLEIASDAALLVRPYDQAGLVQAVTRVIRDPALRQNLINRGIERSKKFTWQKTAVQMWEVFEKAVEH